jgi:N-acetylgalactosamine-6-sulfatase
MPSRRRFLATLSAAALGAAKPPNVIFILADDLGWGDLPCYGHRNTLAHGGWTVRGDLKMPHMDRMAREGTRFTQFYVASAVCSPSRTGFLTGQFPARLGIHDYLADPPLNAKRGVRDWLDPDVPSMTRLLKSAGYATSHFGKWHLGSGTQAPKPEQYGIDRFDACMKQGRVKSSESIADETIAFAEANRERPFFINAWLNDPHSPLHPTEEMMAPYKGLSPRWGDHKGAMEIYYGVLTEMDRHIGRILDGLDRLQLSSNTIVIFSSDNGPESGLIPFVSHYGGAATAGPFRGIKRSLYEGGIRTPFVVRWPGRTPAGRVDNETVLAGVDLMPSLLKLVGSTCPTCDGEDLSETWLGRSRNRSKALMWENRYPVYGHVLDMSPMLAARQGRWKLLMNPDRSRVELYDIPADPSEINNRADREPGVVRDLSARLLRWQSTLPKGPVDPAAGKNRYPWPQPSN